MLNVIKKGKYLYLYKNDHLKMQLRSFQHLHNSENQSAKNVKVQH